MILKEEYIDYVKANFEENRNNTYAFSMEAYMRNKFIFYGIKSPLRKQIQKNIISEIGYPSAKNYLYIVSNFWKSDERELQYFAMELLQKLQKNSNTNIIDFYENLIVEKSWWDTIDFIAPNLIGKLFLNNKDLRDNYIGSWINSSNFWLKRSAIIFQLRYKEQTDFELLKELILMAKHEDEFFVKKAIGWSLREYSKTCPTKVEEFISIANLKPLSVREGLKHINKNKQ